LINPRVSSPGPHAPSVVQSNLNTGGLRRRRRRRMIRRTREAA